MTTPASQPTLYEDWLARRDRLLLTTDGVDPHRRVQLRILEFLLRRYRDSPEAKRLAEFAHTAEVVINDRAIVVHQYLAALQVTPISSASQAESHVKSVLDRMYGTDLGKQRVGSSRPERIQEQQRVQQIRQMCHHSSARRVLAVTELGEVGTLQDIGLLCDLLALPPTDDEHPRERAAIDHALARLAGVTSTAFDLTDVMSPVQDPGATDDEQEYGESANLSTSDEWVCSQCGAEVPNNFEICWSCEATVGGEVDPLFARDIDHSSGEDGD